MDNEKVIYTESDLIDVLNYANDELNKDEYDAIVDSMVESAVGVIVAEGEDQAYEDDLQECRECIYCDGVCSDFCGYCNTDANHLGDTEDDWNYDGDGDEQFYDDDDDEWDEDYCFVDSDEDFEDDF